MDDYIIIRDYLKEEDKPFIYSTWRNSSYYGYSNEMPKERPKEFFAAKTKEINFILETAHIRMALFEDSVIIGYCVFRADTVEFIYVKADFRKRGIGRLLYPKNIKQVSHASMTKIGRYLLEIKGV